MKFAYLIMAHNNPSQLEVLLKLLDNSENDIYLHIDKKKYRHRYNCVESSYIKRKTACI